MKLQLFTSTCQLCNKRISLSSNIFCTECFGHLPKTHFQFTETNIIKEKLKGILKLAYSGAFLYYAENNMVRQILWEMKYNQNGYIAFELGKMAGEVNKSTIQQHIDIIIPIPLHPTKEKIRGYNQTELFGQGLSAATNIPIHTEVLKRRKNTISQTKFSRDDRFQNVAQAFEVQHKMTLQDKRVLLIDDVITTGATLSSAAILLCEQNIKSMNIFCLASAFEI